MAYRGRFAPSPTGLLHAGSVVAALASWLDARAHSGTWQVRIEDVDTPREQRGAAEGILRQLADLGLVSDEPVLKQTARTAAYAQALDALRAQGWAYPCTCSRKTIAQHLAARQAGPAMDRTAVYPGCCRPETRRPVDAAEVPPHAAWRVRVDASPAAGPDGRVHWSDRRLGAQQQDLVEEVGDFVVRRTDGLWSYQLAVVVDDASQGITDVVRGEDLADNTARQRHLQALLGLPFPRMMHTALVCDAEGHKLSKHRGAAAVDTAQPLAVLVEAGRHLDLSVAAATAADWRQAAVQAWAARWTVGLR